VKRTYTPIDTSTSVNRREFVAAACVVTASGAVLGVPALADTPKPTEVETNLADFMKVPRGPHALPGPFPGRVVQVRNARAVVDDRVDGKVVAGMFESGIRALTGRDLRDSFRMFFRTDDVVGLKVNPVGAPLIATKPEVVDAVIRWLVDNGLPKGNIVIWDRFEGMLKDAAFTAQRFPGVRIEGLQTMDEEGTTWRDANGRHVSEGNFDLSWPYLARGIVGKGVRGYKDDEYYLNQHVFAGETSYYGKLITQRLTKIVNLAAYKNTGNGISMATKNLGYGAICNTGRLHQPLFFRVCTEVLAAPPIREKLVLNITDGLIAQYEGGPDKDAKFVWPHRTLYFATDPFALDMVCHTQLVAKRKAMGIQVNENPRFTDYLRQAESLGLGVADPAKIKLLTVQA